MTTVSEAVAERNALAKQPTSRDVLRTLVERNANAVGQSLPTGFNQERFVRLLLTAANTNPELLDCDPRSFLAAGVAAAQLGLEPNDPRGLAYLVPFNDKRRGRVVTLIVGYRGMLDLARRSGLVTAINAFPVFDGDAFTYRLGLDPTLDHVPHPDGDEDPRKLTHVYAVAAVGGEAKQFVVLSRLQIDRIKSQYARSALSPWNTHYVEMALKTALRRLCKWLPQTVELARAVDVEERGLVLTDDLAIPAAIEGHGVDPDVDDAIEVSESSGVDGSAAAPERDETTAVSPQHGRRRRATPDSSGASSSSDSAASSGDAGADGPPPDSSVADDPDQLRLPEP